MIYYAYLCFRFVDYIADDLQDEVRSRIDGSRYLSVMVDAATDCTAEELDLVYVRHLQDGDIRNTYMGIGQIASASAIGHKESMEETFRAAQVEWKAKTVGFGSDGASVMLGCRNGLGVKLKGDIPHLIEIHWVAHRLELASVAAIKGIKQVQDIRDLLKGLSKQYHYSPKAVRELKAVAEALCVKPFRPGNLSGTRWMDHSRKALESLLRDHSSMLAHCEHCVTDKSSSPEMLGRAKQVNTTLTSWPFLVSMFLLRDVFEELSILSLVFQANSTTLSIVMQALETACLNLVAMRELPAKHLDGFLEAVGDGDQYKGHTLKRKNDAALATFLQQKRHLIDVMLKCLDQRFKDFQSRPVLAAAQILNIREWPDTAEDTGATFRESMEHKTVSPSVLS